MVTKMWSAGSLLVCALLVRMPVAAAMEFHTDSQQEAKIRSDLEHLHIEDLGVQVLGWDVTLSGTAESLANKEEATKLAMKNEGIHDVFNDIQVVSVGDDELRRTVMDAIERDRHHYTVYDLVHVLVEDGRVFLTGHAVDAKGADAIVQSVAKVRGVNAIDNEIDTTPMSSADEKLQVALVFVVDNALTPYVNEKPDFHVMVKDGHVSLSGFVGNDEVRKAVGEAVAKADGVRSVDNLLESRNL